MYGLMLQAHFCVLRLFWGFCLFMFVCFVAQCCSDSFLRTVLFVRSECNYIFHCECPVLEMD